MLQFMIENAQLSIYVILEMLNSISDQQAFDVDFGGDSDADDLPSFSSTHSPIDRTTGSKKKIMFN